MAESNRTATGSVARSQREWVLEGELHSMALAVYVFARYAPDPVVVLLQGAGKQRNWPVKADVDIVELVETMSEAPTSHSLSPSAAT